ncbi:hypothetical protein APHAL10511_005276 [Amanita phalloides]|nr:hypothetical protein APHAL10511_005276 [Amanita phalloides]
MNASTSPEPFESPGTGDMILRSVDNTDFYVIKSLLRISSPVFDDMCSLNRGEASEKNESQDGLPIVTLPEDGATLKQLLVQIYPGAHTNAQAVTSNLELFLQVAAAAQKYDIQSVNERMRNHLSASQAMVLEPLRVYAIAVNLCWDNVARTAAMNMLDKPLHDLHYVNELNYLSAAGYHRLLEHRFKCENAVQDMLKQNTMLDHLRRLNVDIGPSGDRKPLCDFINMVAKRAKDQPRGWVALDDSILNRIFTNVNNPVQPGTLSKYQLLLHRRKDIAAAIEAAIEKVPLEIKSSCKLENEGKQNFSSVLADGWKKMRS